MKRKKISFVRESCPLLVAPWNSRVSREVISKAITKL